MPGTAVLGVGVGVVVDFVGDVETIVSDLIHSLVVDVQLHLSKFLPALELFSCWMQSGCLSQSLHTSYMLWLSEFP